MAEPISGGLAEHSQPKDDVKAYANPPCYKTRCGCVCLISTLILLPFIIGVVAIILVMGATEVVTEEAGTNIASCGLHKWCCDGVEHPLLVEEDPISVKLGPKVFDSDEVKRLKTLNGDNIKTTFDIFLEIDQKTRSCTQYTIGGKVFIII